MNRLLDVFTYELRRNFRRRGYLFTTFGIPLLGLVLYFGYQLIGGSAALFGSQMNDADPVEAFGLEGARHAGYVDLANLGIEAGPLSAILSPYATEDEARAAMERGEIDVYYVIAEDYLNTGDVTLVMPRLTLGYINPDPIRQLLMNHLSQDVDDPAVLNRLLAPMNIEEINLARQTGTGGEAAARVRNTDATVGVVYVFAMVLLVSLFVTNGYLMQSVIEEKETRLIEVLLASVRPMQLLAGKVLALGLLGLLQIIMWVAGLLVIARISGATETAGQALSLFVGFTFPVWLLPLLLAYFILAYLLFAAAYAIVGALSNSMREGPQYAAFFTLPAVAPLWFLQLFATQPDGTIPVVLSLFPLTAPIAMIQRLLVTPVPSWQIALSLGLLALSVVGMMWLAGRLFRVQTLLAGQAPKLRDLPMLLRG